MNYKLLAQRIQAGLSLAQHYVFPRVFVQSSLDELKKNRTDPLFYYFNEGTKIKDFDDVQRYSRLLLLSEPGFGKSEFLRQYALYLSEKPNQGKVLPLYIELKGYKPLYHRTLEKYIEEQVKLRFEVDKPLASLKQEYTLAFLLDGFDEVEKNNFSQIVDNIKLFLLNHREHKIIISSRLHFYLHYRSLEEQNFTIAHITSLGNDEIKQYLQESGIGEQEILRLIEVFQEPDFSSILSIPRYLEKYLELYKSGITGRLPRADIYNHFLNFRLEIEDKKYPGRTLKEFYRYFLERLALIMEIYQQNAISRSEFITIVDQLESNLVQAILSSAGIDYLFEKNILVNYGDQISFEDRSLQEYLAACEMAKWGDQKRVYDLAVVEELGQINPSWVNTLAYYLDLNDSFFEYAIEFRPDLILRSNIATLLPNQRTRIFQKILTDCQEKRVWLDFKIAKRIAQLYSAALKTEVEKYMTECAHFVQKGNVALLLGLIPLPEYKQWLIDCVHDDNPNGVLQRHALFSLGEIGDASVIKQAEKVLSPPDALIRQAFLDMCGKLDLEGSVSYFLDAINKSIEENIVAERCLAKIKGREAFIKMLERLVSDTSVLRKLSEPGRRDEYVRQAFEHIEAVYNQSIQDLLAQLVFALSNIYRHNSAMMHCTARLLKKKAPNIWKDILATALQDENVGKHLFTLPTFLSYFITDENLHEFIERIQHVDGYEWTVVQLVNHIQANKENPAHSVIEEKARELLPEYYRKIDEQRGHQRWKLSYEERRFLQWKKLLDQTPLQYENKRFKLFYQCIDGFDERFKLTGFALRKLRAIIKSILSKIDPSSFQITVQEWRDSGGVKTFSQTWEQVLYEKALELNFKLNVGFAERKKLISLLRVIHSGQHELLENILDALGQLQPHEVGVIKKFLTDNFSS